MPRGSVSKQEPDMPVLPTGLVRNPNGRYYHRRRIPEDLISVYRKDEHLKSLKTSDYRTALELFYIADAKLQSSWRAQRQRKADILAARQVEAAVVLSVLSEEDIVRISQHVEAAALAGDERRREFGTYDIDEILEYQNSYREALPLLKAAVAVGDVETLAPMLRQFLMLYRYEDRLSESDFTRLALAYGRAVIRTNEKLLRRYDGEDVPTPGVSVRQQHLLSEVVKDYIDKYQAVRHEAMFKKVGAVLPMFLEVVGDKAIHTLRQTDINHFFDVVNRLPPRWKDIARQKKISVLELSKLGLGEMAPATFEGTYKAVITPFLKTAC
jgi:hypothetical protein